jgi:hypothetical protein
MYLNKNKAQSDMTATPDKYPQKYFKEKECRRCKKLFSPKAPSHLYCSQECADWGLVSNYLKRNYGIGFDKYLSLLEDQKKLCKICNGPGFTMKDTHNLKLVVDHDHETGKIRGLLCHNCNRGLGLFKDSTKSLQKAVEYLYKQ